MILFPAIDLKDGKAVRLEQGDMARATTFNENPKDQARAFADMGFRHLHVVDLNGAFAGHPVNAEAVEAILADTDLKVQLGGGIRDMAAIERWLDRGVTRVILGTIAVSDPDIVASAAAAFPGQIAVGIDARGGAVAVRGWADKTTMTAVEVACRFEDAGVSAIVYTDIDRDGILTGLNIPATLTLANAVSVPVIASGGLAGLADVERLLEPDCAILEGAIAGRALYDGRLDAQEALALIAARAAA